MNVYQKINEVKKVVKVFEKDDKTSGKGAYSFVSGAQILGAIKEKMEEIGLLFLPIETEHRGWTTFNYKNSYGDDKTDFVVDGRLIYEWINCDEPNDKQRVSFEYYGQQNDISKAFGSGLTYSERYLLLKSLGVPTGEDDPDNKNEDKNGTQSKSHEKNKKQTPGTQKKTKWAQVNELIKDSNIELPQVTDWVVKKFKKNIKINDLIKDSNIELPQVTDWVVKKFKKNIKINDLTDEQFESLIEALTAAIESGGDEA